MFSEEYHMTISLAKQAIAIESGSCSDVKLLNGRQARIYKISITSAEEYVLKNG